MAWTTTTDVRLITGLTTSNISDNNLTSIITYACEELASKVNTLVVREPVYYVDNTRQNKIDGSNTTFYVKNWEGKFLGDRNGSQTITTTDISVYLVASDGTETSATVSSVTGSQGKFVLSSAPASTNRMYVTYAWSYFDQETPDPLIFLASTYLAASYALLQIDSGITDMVKMGNISVKNLKNSRYDMFYNKFTKLLGQLNAYSLTKSAWKESTVKI